MKYLLYSFTLTLFLSCQTHKSSAQDTGKVISEKTKIDSDSSFIYGFITELSSGDRPKLSDIWLGSQRFDCDTNGKFKIYVKPGKYKVEARSFGFENLKHEMRIKQGEKQKIMFYLVPFKDEKPSKQIH